MQSLVRQGSVKKASSFSTLCIECTVHARIILLATEGLVLQWRRCGFVYLDILIRKNLERRRLQMCSPSDDHPQKAGPAEVNHTREKQYIRLWPCLRFITTFKEMSEGREGENLRTFRERQECIFLRGFFHCPQNLHRSAQV